MRGGEVANSIALNQQSSPKEDSFNSPYLIARREWDERYGGLIKRAQQWRATAILALLVALAEAIVIIAVAHLHRKPFYWTNRLSLKKQRGNDQ